MTVAYKAPKDKGDGIVCLDCLQKLGGPQDGDEPIDSDKLEPHTFCCSCYLEFESDAKSSR